MNADDLPDFDATAYLADKEALSAFITDLLQDDQGLDLLRSALGDLARARGVESFATAASMTPVELGEALQPGVDLFFDAFRRILAAFGLRLTCSVARRV